MMEDNDVYRLLDRMTPANTFGERLKVIDGKVFGELDRQTVPHPSWQTRDWSGSRPSCRVGRDMLWVLSPWCRSPTKGRPSAA